MSRGSICSCGETATSARSDINFDLLLTNFVPSLYTSSIMPLPKSEYMSDIWKDGIFGKGHATESETLILTRVQQTRWSSAQEVQVPSVVLKSARSSTWEPTRALSVAMLKRRRAQRKKLQLSARVRRSLASAPWTFASSRASKTRPSAVSRNLVLSTS